MELLLAGTKVLGTFTPVVSVRLQHLDCVTLTCDGPMYAIVLDVAYNELDCK